MKVKTGVNKQTTKAKTGVNKQKTKAKTLANNSEQKQRLESIIANESKDWSQ